MLPAPLKLRPHGALFEKVASKSVEQLFHLFRNGESNQLCRVVAAFSFITSASALLNVGRIRFLSVNSPELLHTPHASIIVVSFFRFMGRLGSGMALCIV